MVYGNVLISLKTFSLFQMYFPDISANVVGCISFGVSAASNIPSFMLPPAPGKAGKRNRFTVYDVQASFVLPCYDYISWTGVAKTGEMVYYSVSENYGNGGNYISSIKPGESVQLNMAWIVNESDLKNLYLNVTGDGASYEFSEYILKKGLVDIRK